MRMVSGPQGPRVVLDGKPVLLLCSNNYLGLADHPRVREAAADAAMRWGVGAGASRLVSGHDDDPPPPRGAPGRASRAREAALLFGSGYLANIGVVAALARPRRGRLLRRAQPRLDHRRLPAGARRDVRLRHGDVEHLAWGLRQAERARRADRHRLGLLDGRRRRAAGRDRRARPPPRRARRSSTRRTAPAASGPGGRGAVAEAGARGRGRRRHRHARQGARLLRRVRAPATHDDGAATSSTPRARSSSRPRRRRRRSPARWPRSSCSREQPRRVEKLQANARRAARRAGPRGLRGRRLDDADRAARRRRRRRWRCAICELAHRARRVRPGDPPADGARGHLAPAPGGDGLAHARRAARGRAACSARAALQAGLPPGRGRAASRPRASAADARRPTARADVERQAA